MVVLSDHTRHNPYFLFHHSKTVDEAFVDRLIRAAAPVGFMSTPPTQVNENPRGSPEWEAQAKRLLDSARRVNLFGANWFFPLEKVTHRGRKVLDSQVSVFLKFHEFEVRTHQMVKLDQLLADKEHWGMVTASRSDLLWSDVKEMNWFLDKCRPLLPFYEPDFACADADFAVVGTLESGADPREFAWPLMIFGPGEVNRIGRAKLLDAPAWRVEELPYGGIWLQVCENPFDTPQTDIAVLAHHLGLKERREAPRLRQEP